MTPRIGFLHRIVVGVLELTLELGFEGPTRINQVMTGQSHQVNDVVSAKTGSRIRKNKNCFAQFCKRVSAGAQYPGQLPSTEVTEDTSIAQWTRVKDLQNFRITNLSCIQIKTLWLLKYLIHSCPTQTSGALCFLYHHPMSSGLLLFRNILGGKSFLLLLKGQCCSVFIPLFLQCFEPCLDLGHSKFPQG